MNKIKHIKWIAALWLGLVLIVVAFALGGVRMSKISRDPFQVSDKTMPFYYGFLSNIGVLIWAACAFIAFYSSFLVRSKDQKSLLRWAGILTFILLVDDFLMIHDGLFRYVLHWPEYLVFIFYAIAFPVFLFRHRQIILSQTEYWILGLGFFLAGVSVTMDLKLLPGSIDLEDGCKLFGMAAYAYYWIITSRQMSAQPLPDKA